MFMRHGKDINMAHIHIAHRNGNFTGTQLLMYLERLINNKILIARSHIGSISHFFQCLSILVNLFEKKEKKCSLSRH